MRAEDKKFTKMNIYEIVFVVLCVTINLFVNDLGLDIQLLPLLVILLFKKISVSDELEIKVDKRFVSAFILVFVLFGIVQILYKYSVTEYNILGLKKYSYLIVQLPIVMTIFTAYFMRVGIKDFNWRVNILDVVLIILVWVALEWMSIIEVLKIKGLFNFITYLSINVPLKIYNPSIVEEVIFRGLCFGGLLSLGVDKYKANIIQAVLFGLVHLMNYDQWAINNLLFVAPQIFVGFFIGKIYIKTKSLTPCIILHALIDSI